MHLSAFHYVRRVAWSLPPLARVLELGSREINGSVREIFTASTHYLGVDVCPGPGVDHVADAATVNAGYGSYDCVVTCEVLEHTTSGAEICANAFRHLRQGGVFIVTCAGPDRPEHGCDGGPLPEGEHYAGVSQELLRQWITDATFGFALVDGHSVKGDTYAVAVRF